jgi:ankyrin repeat protein
MRKLCKNTLNRFLIRSIKMNCKKLMLQTIHMGADIDWLDKNGLAPIEYACIYVNYDLLKILVNAGCKINWKDHNSLCLYLAARNEYKLLWALIQRGLDINVDTYRGSTALYWVVQENSFESVKVLLKAGAKVNLLDDEGMTPLYCACADGNNKIVRLLLKYHADVNLEKRTSVLMIASCFGCYNTVKILLENGANVNFYDKEGRNALFHARARKDSDPKTYSKIEELLYSYGADDSVKDYRGISAKDMEDSKIRKMIWNELVGEDE